MTKYAPIGIFDSGYGGLTILKDIVQTLPQFDYIYLGDNARAPYGNRSFDTVYHYTLESVKWLFGQGCNLIILACNTASAKALRTIQQNDLPQIDSNKRVLGVIRPTSEIIGTFSQTKNIGILGTTGTIRSGSYLLEINKFFPAINVFQQACPMWVPLIENNEYNNQAAEYFIRKDIESLFSQSPAIDTLLLACTHYPLVHNIIGKFTPDNVKVISQGPIVADALVKYLHNHPELSAKISTGKQVSVFTTDSPEDFAENAFKFYGNNLPVYHADL